MRATSLLLDVESNIATNVAMNKTTNVESNK
jgi:hypothetical protein